MPKPISYESLEYVESASSIAAESTNSNHPKIEFLFTVVFPDMKKKKLRAIAIHTKQKLQYYHFSQSIARTETIR